MKQDITPKEGDLYKVITTFGKTFELYYGYYEEKDRHSSFATPIEIYPDFIKAPLFTEEGFPFVTAIQEVCEYYEKVADTTNRCIDCLYFQKGEELFGLCKCKSRRKNEKILGGKSYEKNDL